MKRFMFGTLAALALMFCAPTAHAQKARVPFDDYGYCFDLGAPGDQAISASCTVTVYDAGTLNLAIIYSTVGGAAQSNPFAAATNGTYVFYADNGNYDIRLSGGNPALTPYTISNVSVTGSVVPSPTGIICVDGTTYTTIQSAIDDLPASGGIVCTPSGYRETITSQIDLGSATQPVVLQMYPDTILTCNITAPADSCFVVHNGSGIIGLNVGNSTSANGSTGGATIIVASTANMASVITNGEKGAGGQAYLTLDNFLVYGSDGGSFGTVTDAMVDLEGVLNQPVTSNFKIMQFTNTIGLRLASNAATVAGPFLLDNVWIEGLQVGARPLVYDCDSSTLIGGQIIGGVYNYPGDSEANIEILGDGGGAQRCRDLDISTYVEATEDNAIGFKITNWGNINIHGTEAQMTGAGETAVQLNETAIQLLKNITVTGLRTTGSTVVAVSNTVTSESYGTSSLYVPSWTWAGDGGFQDALPVYVTTGGTAVVNDGMVVGARGALGNRSTELVVTPNTGRKPFLIKNYANASMNVDISDTGLNATQVSQVRWLDQGTARWAWEKSATNTFVLRDAFTTNSMAVFNSGAGIDFYTRGTGTFVINNLANAGTGGFRVYSGGASPVLWWYADTSGFNQRDATGTNNVVSASQTGSTTLRNYLDSTLELTLDDGLTTTQDLGISLRDQGTTEWRIRKTNGNLFALTDSVNSQNRMVIPQVADVADSGLLRAGNNENMVCAEANPTGTDLCLIVDTSNVMTTGASFSAATLSGSTVTSTVATGTAPLTVTSTTPVPNLAATPTTYNHSGTQQTNAHLVIDTCTLGTDCAVTLTGASVYTSNTSYKCTALDATAGAAIQIAYTSGSQFTLTGTGTDVLHYLCAGN